MAQSDFIDQLKSLGLDVQDAGDGKFAVPYVILLGPRRGTEVKLGFLNLGDFPAVPPACLHISPGFLAINTTGGAHPNASIHLSPKFGNDWQYWSRPIHHWASTKRTARDVLAHINHLFDTL
jgi:hypothetical protein